MSDPALDEIRLAMADAEARAARVKDVLNVIHMAVCIETGGLDWEQRSGIETVAGMGEDEAIKTLDALVRLHTLLDDLGAK